MSSKRNVRRKSCTDKIRYKFEIEARIACRGAVQTFKDAGLHPYGCNFCGGYHVGHRTHRQNLRRADFVIGGYGK